MTSTSNIKDIFTKLRVPDHLVTDQKERPIAQESGIKTLSVSATLSSKPGSFALSAFVMCSLVIYTKTRTALMTEHGQHFAAFRSRCGRLHSAQDCICISGDLSGFFWLFQQPEEATANLAHALGGQVSRTNFGFFGLFAVSSVLLLNFLCKKFKMADSNFWMWVLVLCCILKVTKIWSRVYGDYVFIISEER